MIRIGLVDDQALLRGGLRAILDAEDDIEVVGEASDRSGAVRLATARLADIVLMDVEMPASTASRARDGSSRRDPSAAW